jgi:alpha-ketoglutarate-dependent taurine dioxygenase
MIITPDFIPHPWRPICSVSRTGDFIVLSWEDGKKLEAYSLWLAENSPQDAIEPSSRESMLEPLDLPEPADLQQVDIDEEGALLLVWQGRPRQRFHPGWLYAMACNEIQPECGLPVPRPWIAAERQEPVTTNGERVLETPAVLQQWLSDMVEHGVARLRGLPATEGILEQVVGKIGPIRSTNFGGIFTVKTVPNPDSTAYTGINLGQHTDLPTREVPPGFQFLFCVANTVTGGSSRMTDGLALVAALKKEQPEAFEALTELNWVFMNRAQGAQHMWVGPIIELAQGGRPLTIRAFYPVRSCPNMPTEDQPRAYAAMKIFSRYAHDANYQMSYPFQPGDLVGFDNRRILHGRDAFDSNGERHLEGCYLDHDDIFSTLRVLNR